MYLWTDQNSAELAFSISAEYLVAKDAIIEFTQSDTLHNGKVHADDTYAPSPDALEFGDQFGFLSNTFGRWSLRWNQENRTFKITAPQSVLSQGELLDLAAHVNPLP